VHHKNLFRALPNNAVIAGLIAAMNPDEILARAITGTDVNAMPMWRDECEGKHEFFSSTVRPTERIFTISFPVVDSDVVTDLTGLGAAGRRSKERDRAEMTKAADVAAAIASRLPSVFQFEPLTSSQMVWLWNHALSRGGAPEVFPTSVPSNVSFPAGAPSSRCRRSRDETVQRHAHRVDHGNIRSSSVTEPCVRSVAVRVATTESVVLLAHGGDSWNAKPNENS